MKMPRWDGFWWVAGIVAVPVIGGLLSWYFWEELRDSRGSLSATVRNIALVIGGVTAVLLAMWRSKVAERQADTAQRQAETADRGLLNDRYQKAAEMLGSSVLAVRLGGIYALLGLAEQDPKQYHLQTIRLLCAFVRNPQKDGNIPEQPEDAERFVLREDVQEAMRVIGARSDKHRRLAAEKAYYIDLHGADLRGGELRSLNLSSPSADMIGSIPIHKLSYNPTLRTDLSGARLRGADFLFTEISGVAFSRNGESPATGLGLSQLSGASWDDAHRPTLKGLVDALTGGVLEDEWAKGHPPGEPSESP